MSDWSGPIAFVSVYRFSRRVALVSTADEINRSHRGAVILCGGGSRRMGRDKASLPFGDESLLARMMRLVTEAVPQEQIVLVAAAEQLLPPLPWDATVVRDRAADRGPLPALVEGLAALPATVSAALVVACDAPLLQPPVVERLFELLPPGADAIVPRDGERLHPLLAIYRVSAVGPLRAAIERGESSLHRALRSSGLQLFELPIDRLRSVDPQLRSFHNCNSAEEYQNALKQLS
jgi:molybdenum cofactor guanylyltransferase